MKLATKSPRRAEHRDPRGEYARYQAIFAQAAVGIAYTSLEGRITEANAAYCDMLGYAPAEIAGKTTRELTAADDRDVHDALREQLIRGERTHFAVEKRYLRRDGTVIWVHRTVTIARDAANEQPFLIQVVHDISERKRAEQQLERLRRARDVTSACRRVLAHVSDEAGLLSEVCRIAVDLGGYQQAWIGLAGGDEKCPITLAAHAGYRAGMPLPMTSPAVFTADGRYKGKMVRVLARGEPAIERDIVAEAPDEQMRERAVRHGWRSSLTVPLLSDGRALGGFEFNARETDAFDNDEITLLSELACDIAFALSALRDKLARSEAELQAREHERRFRATFDQAAVGIVHTTLDGRYLQANRRFCEMVGYQANELIGRVAAELMHPQDRDKGAHYRQLMWDGKLDKLSEEKRYVRKDGSVLWTNRTISIARDESGQPMYFIRVIEDITEHKLAAQRRDMEHAVTAVLAESPTLEAAMPTIIRIICDGQQWACGFFWRWDEATELLRCADVWHADNAEIEDFVAFSRKRVTEAPAWTGQPRATPDLGPLRSTWFSGAPVWIADIAKRANFRRGTEAACANLHCAFCFPVLSGDRPLGVMEFFSREIKQPDEALLRAVQAIGRQIGQFIQRKLAEEAQRVSEERYRDMFDRSPSPMWVWDDETLSIITVNQAAIDHYGYSREEFEHMSLRELWVPSERARNEENIRERAQLRTMYVQSTHYTKDQRVISVEVTARAFKLGSRSVWLTLVNDVTERLRVEEKLLHLAHYDTLTDLPNRVLFYDRLRKTLALSKRNGWITGVLFMDIDRFKNINDTLGHAVGDQLLRQVSERLVCSVRASDTVGRLGGDEFAVVLTNLTLDTDAGVVAQKIIDKFNEPFRLDGAEVYVTPSIGITLYPKDGTEQDELIKHADAAMYRAKDSGRNNFQYYSPEMSVRGQAVLQLEGSLRRALEHDEFLLHYQPKADIASGVINGCEALLRWQRLGKGLVSPAEFIPVLEETGLIVQAGEWVLNTVCKQINTWLSAGITPVPIAVNLSARQFLQPDLGTTIERILASHNIDPKWIELEITESSLMANPQDAARVLGFLKSLGLSISIDDFGTGYSSLSYLKRFPLDALKIDRSFVRDISTDANDAAITRAVISMAHSLGLKVVAEGVETSEQLAFLAEHRCDIVQGYYLAKPLPAQQCTQALVERLRLKRPAA